MVEDVEPHWLLLHCIHKAPHGVASGTGERVVCSHNLQENHTIWATNSFTN